MQENPQWQLLEWYRGCPIEHRPGMQRRGYRLVYHNDAGIITMVHYTADKCRNQCDRLHKSLGAQVELTEKEYEAFS